MRLYMKIGTHPAVYVEALRLRKPPCVGQWITIREPDMRGGWLRPTRVLVDLVRDLGGHTLFFARR